MLGTAMSATVPDPDSAVPAGTRDSPWAIGRIFLRLGLSSFGGPVAHLGYFHDEFVTRRRWLSEAAYAELVALCQFLPGPASSQVGLGLGLQRGGYAGALAAWAGFTLPSAIALIGLALGLTHWNMAHPLAQGALHGLKVVAVAVVAQAVWGMARKLCPDWPRRLLALATAIVALWWPTPWTQVGLILLAAGLGAAGLMRAVAPPAASAAAGAPAPSVRGGAVWLTLFFVLLIALPVLTLATQGSAAHAVAALVDAFYRAGALVFGGGHVVLPLLQAEVVPPGWVGHDSFLAGYGAAQAVPGPLFTFAAFLGAAMTTAPSGWAGGLLCLAAIFLPSFLLVAGALPFWERLRQHAPAQAALAGVNAAVVGLLLAALYDPVWTAAIHTPKDFALALTALVALMAWKLPPWGVVLATGVAGWLLG